MNKTNKICAAQEPPVGPHSQVGQPIPAVLSLSPAFGIPPDEGLPFLIQTQNELLNAWREQRGHPLLFKVTLEQGENTNRGKQVCPGSCIG